MGVLVEGGTFNRPFLGIRRDQALPVAPVFGFFLPIRARCGFQLLHPSGAGSPFVKDFCAEAFTVERCNVPRIPFLDLEQMLPTVFTCQFVFGSGLSRTNVRDQFIHLDFSLAHSLIGDTILDRPTANIRSLETPRLISVGYGLGDRVTVYEIASCQLRGKGI